VTTQLQLTNISYQKTKQTQISSNDDDDDDSARFKFCTTEEMASEFCPQMFLASCNAQ
jgi:hypothetical protein